MRGECGKERVGVGFRDALRDDMEPVLSEIMTLERAGPGARTREGVSGEATVRQGQ